MMATLFVGFARLARLFIAPILNAFVMFRSGTKNMVGDVFSSFGVLYGTLLGLTAVAADQNWFAARMMVAQEGGGLQSLHAGVSSFPEPRRTAMKEEWALLRQVQLFIGSGEVIERNIFRVYSVTKAIPAECWYVVVIGAVFNVILIWVLDMKMMTQFFWPDVFHSFMVKKI